MIHTSTAAFGFLREHKTVEESVEDFVLKRLNGRCSPKDMLQAFENGIGGQYGKIYTLDAATLLGWVDKYLGAKNTSSNYLASGLLNVNEPYFEYSNEDWHKEANKCLIAFFNGVNECNFHPSVYDRMMIDGKIPINACMKYLEGDKVVAAKQRVLRDVFESYKSNGWSTVYLVK